MENIDSSSDSSHFSKRYHPVPLIIHELFVVDESDSLLEDGVQERHVTFLRFNGVGEDAVGFVGDQLVDWDLFHAENDAGFGNVFLDYGASVQVVLHRVGPAVAGLHYNFDSISDEFPHLDWGERGPAFPDALVFSSDCYHLFGCLKNLINLE